jgi:hypothetical protein
MPRPRLLLAAVALCGVGALTIAAFVRWSACPLLVPRGGAEWVRAARPFTLRTREPEPEAVAFLRVFERPEPTGRSAAKNGLTVQALRSFRVFVNGRSVGGSGAGDVPWWNPRTFELGAHLRSGTNEVRVEVENARGPPLLLAWSDELDVATGEGWEAIGDDHTARPVLRAGEGRRLPISSEYPSAWQGLRAAWRLLLVAFAVGAGASLAHGRSASAPAGAGWRLRPGPARWLAMGALAVLGLHNLTRLAIQLGYDANDHLDYVRYVAQTWRVPLAGEGWQAFQPPLFYFVAALQFLVIGRLVSEGAALLSMRVLMLACALGLVEMVYRSARAAFPRREDLQLVATSVGGFLPMTVYMSHYVSNEPFAAVLAAALVVGTFLLLADGDVDVGRWSFRLGALFGLALLAKVTVALLLPLVAAALVWAAMRRGGGLRSAVAPALRFGIAGGSIAGWYFVRNWLELGRPYVGGWDASRGMTWIQDPGYRVPADLFGFGASLSRPIYAVFSGFWDGIYSTFWLDGDLGSRAVAFATPPWSFDHLVACALLAPPLTAAGFAGAVRALRVPRDRTQRALLFSAAAVAAYLAAILVMFLTIPVYSVVKSSYAMGLAPCCGALIAWGFDLLPKHAAVRAVGSGYLAVWLAFVFRAYFS